MYNNQHYECVLRFFFFFLKCVFKCTSIDCTCVRACACLWVFRQVSVCVCVCVCVCDCVSCSKRSITIFRWIVLISTGCCGLSCVQRASCNLSLPTDWLTVCVWMWMQRRARLCVGSQPFQNVCQRCVCVCVCVCLFWGQHVCIYG